MAVDALLLQSAAPAATLGGAVASAARDAGIRRASVTTHAAIEGPDAYAYLWSDTPIPVAAAHSISRALTAMVSRDASPFVVLVLRRLNELPGASAQEPAPFHYVVETRVDAINEVDFNTWYDTEHLPGLSAVPGCVCARRLCTLDARPTYVACYDLVVPDVLSSEAWLAVRRTPWSSRVRPTFRDTKRTMFRTTSRSALDRAPAETRAARTS